MGQCSVGLVHHSASDFLHEGKPWDFRGDPGNAPFYPALWSRFMYNHCILVLTLCLKTNPHFLYLDNQVDYLDVSLLQANLPGSRGICRTWFWVFSPASLPLT